MGPVAAGELARLVNGIERAIGVSRPDHGMVNSAGGGRSALPLRDSPGPKP
jgi:hypothetical protein